MPKLSMNFQEFFSLAHGNFEEQNVLQASIIFIIITLKLYCIINTKCNYNISNKGLLEECDKEEHVEVSGAAATSCLRRITQ